MLKFEIIQSNRNNSNTANIKNNKSFLMEMELIVQKVREQGNRTSDVRQVLSKIKSNTLLVCYSHKEMDGY